MSDELCEMPHPSHPEWHCEKPKGHDVHLRPGDAWCTAQEAWAELIAERDALRDGILSLADEMLHNVESHNVGA